ncbi:HD-GYP domain-containing protein [Maridesulfovibrio hydrothermalis]|uniref:Metal dependent phosphohydrolase n=1 Tax=Maridesulfovibrio hydrothermalis AM13 = DSM 14728 TaxID=1121451 RepID=L0RAN1_9BACT|nr:HD domain-containing phosphohydrolase [Maridesulfovibrio hydrothermalis]CCO22626.1 Metal dependent phosphohydrolase [Maridesulfovibrio hydrothermalis AM13 = DSM 14728]
MNNAAAQHDIGSEEFLQISANITSTFGNKLPVTLCIYDNEVERVVPLYEQGVRLSDKKTEIMNAHCNEGNLFISKTDYTGLAGHISKNLGALLTEHYLDEAAAAEIFYEGVLEKVRAFYANPIGETLDEIKTVLAIYSEYVWIDQNRWAYFFNTLKRENDLCCHVVNTLFVGTAIYLKTVHKQGEKLDLSPIALGLILHDLGMTQMPAALTGKKGPFLYKERMRMQEHVDIAEKMLNRLDIKDEVIKACIFDHHERLDGSGYPKGRRGDAITIEARVCSIADAFCAMISERWQRAAINPILAAIILSESKKQFDPALTTSLISFIIANNPEMKALITDKAKMKQLRAIALQKCAQ